MRERKGRGKGEEDERRRLIEKRKKKVCLASCRYVTSILFFFACNAVLTLNQTKPNPTSHRRRFALYRYRMNSRRHQNEDIAALLVGARRIQFPPNSTNSLLRQGGACKLPRGDWPGLSIGKKISFSITFWTSPERAEKGKPPPQKSPAHDPVDPVYSGRRRDAVESGCNDFPGSLHSEHVPVLSLIHHCPSARLREH